MGYYNIIYNVFAGQLPITATLYSGATIIDSTVHDTYGTYQFDFLQPGDYHIRLVDFNLCNEDIDSDITPTPTPTVTPTVTPSITPSITPTITPSVNCSSIGGNFVWAEYSPTPTPTISVTPTITPTITPTTSTPAGIITSGLTLHADTNLGSYTGGTTFYDLSGNDYDGTLAGNISYVSGSTPTYLDFTGTTNGCTFASGSTGSDTGSHTVGGWFNFPTNNTMIHCVTRGLDTFSILLSKNGNKIYGYPVLTTPSQLTPVAESVSAVTTNTWYYFSAVLDYSGQTYKLYINGDLKATSTFAGSTNLRNSSAGWNIGQYATGGPYSTLKTSGIHTYNRALSASELVTNFDNTKATYGY